MLEHALKLAERGLRIVILHHPLPDSSAEEPLCSCLKPTCGSSTGKHPVQKGWAQLATADRVTIQGWLTKRPNANIGVCTGGRIFVIDVDGRAGYDWLADLPGELPLTLTTETPSGGRHLFFRVADPKQLPKASVKELPGIDIRAKKGLVVVPPSKHYNGERYQFGADVPIAMAPEWLLPLLPQRPSPSPPAPPPPRGPVPDDDYQKRIDRVGSYLRAVPGAVSGQGGHDHTYNLARNITRGFDLRPDDVWPLFVNWNATCEPPWDERDLRRKLEQGWHADSPEIGARLLDGRPPPPPVAVASTAVAVARPEPAPAHDPFEEDDDGPDEAETPGRPRLRLARADDQLDWRTGLLRNLQGVVVSNTANAMSVLTHEDSWEKSIAYDDFQQTIVALRAMPAFNDDRAADLRAGEIQDGDVIRLQAWLQRRHGISLHKTVLWDVFLAQAEKQHVHPVRDYLNSLAWDGVDRLDRLCPEFLGTPDDLYTQSVGRCFCIGAVARIMDPGCKLDTMPVLVGRQGILKSTAIQRLFGSEWFSDTPVDLRNKDRFGDVQGKWCLEFAELDALSRADVERQKSYLSSSVDNYRPPYARKNIRFKRQCVFIGTTNKFEFLSDATGNRRYWPVVCKTIHIKAISNTRDQFWAEAVTRYRAGEIWHATGEFAKLAKEAQERHRGADVWQQSISRWLAIQPQDATISLDEVFNVVGVEKPHWTQADGHRLRTCLTAHGWMPIGNFHWVRVDERDD